MLFLIPALAVAALILSMCSSARPPGGRPGSLRRDHRGITLFGVVGLYPDLLPSSLNPAYSLTIINSSSSPLTLKIMLGVALTFVPIVIAYQVWVHFLFKDKIREEDLTAEEGY